MRGLCLMYHDVQDGPAPAHDIPAGAARYHVSKDTFRRQLRTLRSAGARTRTVGEYAGGGVAAEGDSIMLTFDDGWEGSLSSGVECLLEAGMSATFFITRDFVGKRHFAAPSLLREAHAAGMELGTHGATHRFLSNLPAAELEIELASSKRFLEDLVGAPVRTGSVPGGAWSPLVASLARECGYAALCTSRPGLNGRRTDPFALRRVAIRRATQLSAFERYAKFKVGRDVVRAAALETPRRLLGRQRYAALRTRLLGDQPASAADGRF
jgi:peptidoglycan/xylan/chitin deacetylase (PgdA/CDA1 family)